MLEQVLKTSQFVVKNATHVKINYEKANQLKEELLTFDNIHYLTKVPYDIFGMKTKDIINFLLIYDAIDFSFWGNPKWTIDANGKDLDGGIALLHCLFNLFVNRDSIEVYKELETMSFKEFKNLLKGNVEIPLLKERYEIVTNIATIVNKKMNGNFYEQIKDMTNDLEIFSIIISNFNSFTDKRTYKNHDIYFYKLAQLLTSDILHVLEIKEHAKVNYFNLIGCADYKIPQVLHGLEILEYDKELTSLIESKTEINENSKYEVEIRASMIIVVNYLYEELNQKIARIDINDFIWKKGQSKNINYKPYHLTRTTTY